MSDPSSIGSVQSLKIRMREIKFRWVGKNRKFNEIYISDPLTTKDLLDGSYPTFFKYSNRYNGRNNKSGNCEFIAEILNTGLKDKNGTEIYEGDIVNCSSGCPHIIEWMQEVPSNAILGGGMPGFYFSGLTDGYAFLGSEEVIGNIYENPELL